MLLLLLFDHGMMMLIPCCCFCGYCLWLHVVHVLELFFYGCCWKRRILEERLRRRRWTNRLVMGFSIRPIDWLGLYLREKLISKLATINWLQIPIDWFISFFWKIETEDANNRLVMSPSINQSIGVEFFTETLCNQLVLNSIDRFNLVLPKTTYFMFLSHLGWIITCIMMCMH